MLKKFWSTLLIIVALFSIHQTNTGAQPVSEFFRDPLITHDFFDPFFYGQVFSNYEASGVHLPAFSEFDGSPRDNITAGGTPTSPDVAMFLAYNGLDHFLAYGREKSVSSNGYDLYLQVRSDVGDAPTWTSPLLSASGNCSGGCPYGFSQFQNVLPDYQDEGVYVLWEDGAEGGPIPLPSGNTHLAHLNDNTGAVDWQETFNWQSVSIVSDGASGIYVLRDSGPHFDGAGSTSVGILEHYDISGKDLTFGGTGSVIVSSDGISNKGGATLVTYLDSGFDYDPVVIWADDDGVNPGIYARRFDEDGTPHPSFTDARGKRVVAVPNIDAQYFSDFPLLYQIHAEGNPIIAEDNIVGAAILDGELSTFSFDGDGVNLYPCEYNQVTPDFEQFDIVMQYGISGGDKGVFLIWQDGNDLNMSLVSENGESYWAVGGNTVASSGTLEVTLKKPGFSTNARGRYEGTSAILDASTGGGTLIYGTGGVGFTQFDFDDSSFASGGGGDCSAGSPPDAPTLSLDAVGNGEIDLSLIPGADNGSAHTDFVWQYKEASSGVWITFPDGVSIDTALTITGLSNRVLYDFRAAGINGIGQGAFSAVVQGTPIGAGGRRRLIPTGGAWFFFGNLSREPNASGENITGNSTVSNFINQTSGGAATHGAAAEDEAVQESDLSAVNPENFSLQEYLSSNINTDKRDSIILLDLIVSLRWLMEWYSEAKDYQLLSRHQKTAEKFQSLFRTRWFHYIAGVDYLERIRKVNYDFEYRYPVKNETEIVVFMMRSVLLTFGRSCISPEVLAYAEEVDVPGEENEYWYYRYVQIMKPWMDAVLGEKGYQLTRGTKDIDALEAVFILLHQFCIGDGFKNQVAEEAPQHLG